LCVFWNNLIMGQTSTFRARSFVIWRQGKVCSLSANCTHIQARQLYNEYIYFRPQPTLCDSRNACKKTSHPWFCTQSFQTSPLPKFNSARYRRITQTWTFAPSSQDKGTTEFPSPLLSRFLRSHDINLCVSDVFNHIKRSKRICRQQRQLKVNVNRVFYAYTHTVGKTKTWLRVLGNISVKSCEAIVSKLARRNGDFVYSALKFMPNSRRTLYSSYRFPHARQAHMR
jgi:hypothetical protein